MRMTVGKGGGGGVGGGIEGGRKKGHGKEDKLKKSLHTGETESLGVCG